MWFPVVCPPTLTVTGPQTASEGTVTVIEEAVAAVTAASVVPVADLNRTVFEDSSSTETHSCQCDRGFLWKPRRTENCHGHQSKGSGSSIDDQWELAAPHWHVVTIGLNRATYRIGRDCNGDTGSRRGQCRYAVFSSSGCCKQHLIVCRV